jgi:hypothetical protein
VRLNVDLHEYLIQVPLPVYPQLHSINSFPTDLNREYLAKSVKPKSNHLVADVNAACVQQIFKAIKRKRETNIHHDGQMDNLWARLEVTKEGCVLSSRNATKSPCSPQPILL